MTAASKEIDFQNREDNVKAVQTLKGRGIIFISPREEALAEWFDIARIASKKMVDTGVLPKDVADRLDAHLKNFEDPAHATTHTHEP
jgi:predicted methyltransferase